MAADIADIAAAAPEGEWTFPHHNRSEAPALSRPNGSPEADNSTAPAAVAEVELLELLPLEAAPEQAQQEQEQEQEQKQKQ